MDFETKGMLRWFVKGQSDVTSTGALSKALAPLPALFVSDGLWKKKRSYRKVAFDAITTGDQPVLKAVVGWTAVLFVFAQLLTDILYRAADPRVSLN